MRQVVRRRASPAAAIWMAIAAVAAAAHAAAETMVLAHHVEMSGRPGKPAALATTLRNNYAACVESRQRHGLSVKPLGTVPSGLDRIEADVYYTANRVLMVERTLGWRTGTRPMSEDCGVNPPERLQTVTLMSAAGVCKTDPVHGVAVGQCDERMHRQAPPSRLALPAPDQLDPDQIPGLHNAPPQVRQQVIANYRRAVAQYQAQGLALEHVGRRAVAGMRCDLYRQDLAGTASPQHMPRELCIANPDSPFAIPATELNRDVPGLLLETSADLEGSPYLAKALQAEHVHMSVRVPESLFMVPPELRRLQAGFARPLVMGGPP